MVCPPLWWCRVQGSCTGPHFCSGLFKSGSCVFWSLCIFCPEFAPTVHAHNYFLVPYSLYIFCCRKRGVSRFKHCGPAAKGPRSQPVSDLERRLDFWMPGRVLFSKGEEMLVEFHVPFSSLSKQRVSSCGSRIQRVLVRYGRPRHF